ncbi:hypothetical protein DU000_09130 [Parvibium lacunae]|uniref:Uncharacterized protein n=1 Tax=Parvibium lacunae TaxID=1888893 RepID=A0A368L1F4_9BURK|nr:hypothetical protein DU000_09130 [Parvibium lacunae]
MAQALGASPRLLIGLGTGNEVATIQAQISRIDIYDRYINNVGPTSWPYWVLPTGEYINQVTREAAQVGAVPMFTLYQMATNGDGNLSGLTDTTFMTNYWNNVRILFQKLGAYNKPALVHFEPDFWGYAHRASVLGEPATVGAKVKLNSDCVDLGDHVAGLAQCLIRMARNYAPKTKVGFPPADWGEYPSSKVADFMLKLGADQADFTVLQTLDTDAGCMEARTLPECQRTGSQWYWDTNNVSTPNFRQHLTTARLFRDTLGLPLIWWQTPMGVPATTPGGSNERWRDNRVKYFFDHPDEVVAAGGVAIVFSGGPKQTKMSTDGGQFRNAYTNYLSRPVALP